MDGELLGTGHAQLVRDLIARLETIVQGDVSVPRVVVLEGASGTGKSRIVREVYRTLCERQSSPSYWPPLAEHTGRRTIGAGSDPIPDRKRLGPSLTGFVWPAGALPSFAWWVLDCDRMPQGDLLDVISQARPSIEAHLTPVRLAWRDAAGWPSRLAAQKHQLISRAREAAAEGGVEAASELMKQFGLVVPGLSLGLGWLKRGVNAYRTHREEQFTLSRDVGLGGDTTAMQMSAADELATTITRVAHLRVPAVVVIEDLHLLGPDLAEFLTTVAQRQPKHPVIVIGTAWAEGRHNPVYDRWFRATDIGGNVERWEVPSLGSTDLVQLLRRYAPTTDDTTAGRIVERFSNPLALQLYLSLEDTQDQITDGRLTVMAEELDQLPADIRDLYMLRWRELPEATRLALRYAAAALPPDQPVFPYSLAVMVSAIASTGDIDESQGSQVLREAADAYSWTVAESRDRHRFRESILTEIAAASLPPRKRAMIRAAVREQLTTKIDARRNGGYCLPLDEESGNHASRWLSQTPAADGRLTVADAVAIVHVARLYGEVHQPARARAYLLDGRWKAPLDPEHRDTLRIRRELAAWMIEDNQAREAISDLKSVLTDAVRIHGDRDPDILEIRFSLAVAYESDGNPTPAIALFEQNLTDIERNLGNEDQYATLAARNNLALACESAGELSRAISLLERNLTDFGHLLGDDDLNTLAARANLAGVYLSTNPDRAIKLLKEDLIDLERILGADDTEILVTRNNLAVAYELSGDLSRAIPLYERNLAESKRILEDGHPTIGSYRWNLHAARQAESPSRTYYPPRHTRDR